MNVIECRALTKRYGRFVAVDALDMRVRAGDIYGFVGKNGAGKSTTMKMIAGLATPSAGTLTLFGAGPYADAAGRGAVDAALSAGSFSDAPSRLGALIEEPGVLMNFSAVENLMMKALALGVIHPKDQVAELLELVGLGEAGPRKVKKFSQGMKQQLTLAIAYLTNARYLLLDEPMNALDPTNVQLHSQILRNLARHGTAVVMSSHILENVDAIADRILFIKDRGLIEHDPSCGSARALELYNRLYRD